MVRYWYLPRLRTAVTESGPAHTHGSLRHPFAKARSWLGGSAVADICIVSGVKIQIRGVIGFAGFVVLYLHGAYPTCTSEHTVAEMVHGRLIHDQLRWTLKFPLLLRSSPNSNSLTTPKALLNNNEARCHVHVLPRMQEDASSERRRPSKRHLRMRCKCESESRCQQVIIMLCQ